MDVFHNVCSNDCVKVSFHEIKDKVQIFIVLGFENVKQRNDVRMAVQLLQKDNLNDNGSTSRYVR